MIRLCTSALLVTLALSPTTQAQQYVPLLDGERRDLLHEALSGETAKDHVIQITRHSRIQGSRGYRASAHYVLEQLRAAGFSEDEAFIESYPSDGRIEYQTWQSPSGWDITRAELRMVEPYDERIVGYPEVAMSVITYSNPGDVTAELVWVGSGTRDSDYDGKDVRGKLVLATGYGGSVHRLAVIKYGAAAVVAYLDDDRAKLFPDMLQYTGMWPLPDEVDHVTFGFNISNRQGERLRSMLERGQRVVMHGSVEGIGLEPYYMDIVVARIEGSELPDEEIIISAHLDHPKESANDNASGSAAILDMANTLRSLIDEGRMERPRRSIRFLWVPEWHGTMAYIDAHPEMVGPGLGGTSLANINMDMVGEHLELLHSRMIMTRTPASIPSALNDVVENMAQMVDGLDVRSARGSLSRFNYAVTGYGGGSDHMMFIDLKIPGMMFGHSPDYTHHTSDDTPDKVDPVELERSEIIATATTLFLSDLSDEESAGHRAWRLLTDAGMDADEAWFEAYNTVAHAAAWEFETVESVLGFNGAPAVVQAVEAAQDVLLQQTGAIVTALRADAGVTAVGENRPYPNDDRIPARLTRGPLAFALPGSLLPDEAAAWYSSPDFTLNSSQRFELVNFIDGELTVSEIRDALSAEYGPVSQDVVARYLEDLVRVGVAEWK